MKSIRRRVPIACFFAALTLCAIGLWRVRPTHLPDRPNASDALLITVWIVAAIVTTWLALSSAMSALRRLVPAFRSCATFDIATLPWIQTVFDRALAVGIVAATLLPIAHGTAATAAGRPIAAAYVRGSGVPATSVVGVSASDPTVARAERPQSPDAESPPYVRGSATRTTAANAERNPPTGPAKPHTAPPTKNVNTYVVRAGDNLWRIAKAELERRSLSTSDASVAHYWGELLRANRQHLQSGNPSVIFVGEVLRLPT